MIRVIAVLLALLGNPAFAQTAVVDPTQSAIRDGWGTLRIELGLNVAVPYRVFTLDTPRRLVVDFQDVDWSGLDAHALLDADRARAVRFGPLRPGWSRMVVDLAIPLAVTEAGMRTGANGAALTIVMEKTSESAFTANAGAPPDPGWDALTAAPQTNMPTPPSGDLVVVIDPGHGGIDPGAERGGEQEADLMLALGQTLAAALNQQAGITAILSREADIFVPLEARTTFARAAGADLLISLHADALEQDAARGASVYTLSEAASDAASAQMVERHEGGDLLAGMDLSGQTDEVNKVLMDLARQKTGPSGARFAETLVSAMRARGVDVNSRARRFGQLAVLNSADFPAVLLEAGFLSNPRDRRVLASTQGRQRIVDAAVAAVLVWGQNEGLLNP